VLCVCVFLFLLCCVCCLCVVCVFVCLCVCVMLCLLCVVFVVSGRLSGEGNGNPLQYSCLGNPMGRGAWRATDCGSGELGMAQQLNNNK